MTRRAEVRDRVTRALQAIRSNPGHPVKYWAKAYRVHATTLYDAINAAGLSELVGAEAYALEVQAGVLLDLRECADRMGITFREAMIEACTQWIASKA